MWPENSGLLIGSFVWDPGLDNCLVLDTALVWIWEFGQTGFEMVCKVQMSNWSNQEGSKYGSGHMLNYVIISVLSNTSV